MDNIWFLSKQLPCRSYLQYLSLIYNSILFKQGEMAEAIKTKPILSFLMVDTSFTQSVS